MAENTTATAAPAAAFVDALVKKGEAHKKTAQEARSRRLGYGVFQTADGHVISLNYTPKGKETDWTLWTPQGKAVATFPRKVDALNHWESKIAKPAK